MSLPHLETHGVATRLIVDGEPFIIRGGELTNSGGERAYLRSHWDKLVQLGLNTVVAPVYWDVVEPTEGRFDFSTVDHLLEDAAEHGMKLVLLWFGSWKNSMSCYAPAWVKKDVSRFPRARSSRGEALEILTPFSTSNRDADSHAFAALMRHLRETDAGHTVVMVQVNNEIGMIPEARDHSDAARERFEAQVPTALLTYLRDHADALAPEMLEAWSEKGRRSQGTWSEVFGTGPVADELFMAWAFASYVEAITVAGKAELPLPMYTNAALIRPGMEPGQYPGAGPLPHLVDVWRAAAPSLDFIAPDIYFPNFAEWADRYVSSGNPLFVPEALRSIDAAANALYAYGQHAAIGFSPFGIETISGHAERLLTECYHVIAQLSPVLSEYGGTGRVAAFLPPADDMRAPHRRRFGDLIIGATYERVPAPELADGVINESGDRAGTTRLPAAAIIIHTGQDELLVAGIGVTMTFASLDGAETVGILNCAEGSVDQGRWQHFRWLNGDQTHQGRHVRLEPGRFTIQQVRLYRYR